jgi:hypothetical protein
MAGRVESLRNILATVPGAARLTEEQRKEIVAHLDDSVDAKVGAGSPEVEAVAQAFVELGDVRKIARRFPPPPLLSTPEGVNVVAAARARAWTAFGLLVFFMLAQQAVTPRFAALFRQVKVHPPPLSEFFIGMSDDLAEGFPVKLLIVALAPLAVLISLPRLRAPRAASTAVLVMAWSLCLGLFAALCLPLLRVLQGIGRI